MELIRTSYLIRDLIEAIRVRGIIECALIIWGDLRADSFDREYSVETDKDVILKKVDTVGANFSSSTFYRAVRSAPLRSLLRDLNLDKSFGFVDFGAGKGRSMILAAEYGFEIVSGIEFSQPLFQKAEQNISLVRNKWPSTKFRLIHGDVCSFEPDSADSVFFFYDPFDFPIVEACLLKIKKSWQSYPRKIIVIYHNNLSGLDSISGAWHSWLNLELKTIQHQNFYVFRTSI